jgi:hypothetical protein
MTAITVEGLDGAIALLDKYRSPELDKLLTKATKAGATSLRSPIRDEAPVDSGDLRSAVRIRKSRRTPNAYVVGPRSVLYAHLVIGGTKPHQIAAHRVGGFLFFGGRLVPKVHHPGSDPDPFVERGFDRGRHDAEDKMVSVIAEPLKEAKRG